MNQNLPRKSTSDECLRDALEYGSEKYNANTVLLKLSDLEFRHCEGYYSRNEQACIGLVQFRRWIVTMA